MKNIKRLILLLIVLVGGWLLISEESVLHDLPEKNEEHSARPEESGDLQLYFSNAYLNDPEVGRGDRGNIDRRLADVIAGATTSIDAALFEIESPRIAEELVKAVRRGVRIRMVLEEDQITNHEVDLLRGAGIPLVTDGRSARMHNKFLVIDRERVWTGSMNVTDNGAWKNNNNGVLIRSEKIAENYTAEFEEMFIDRSFGARSPSRTPNTLVKLGEVDIYNYFAPEDDVVPKITRLIRLAKREIRFMAFSFTDDEIGTLLVERFHDGLDVAGIVEAWGASLKSSEIHRFREAGMPVLTDRNSGLMHHKVMVIDRVWTILGSYNFSASAATQNDENVLIIKSEEIARQMLEEYDRVRRIGD